MAIFNKLHLFWRHSDCTLQLKLQAFDAIIRSRLMYGLESVVFSESHVRKLDVFQLKGLHKILKLPTTFINREATNAFVYAEANKEIQRLGGKPIQNMSDFHKQRLKIFLAKLITLAQSGNDPIARATLQDNLIAPHDYGKKRVGRPRLNWVKKTIMDFLDEIKQQYDEAKYMGDFVLENVLHDALMRRHAQKYHEQHEFSNS